MIALSKSANIFAFVCFVFVLNARSVSAESTDVASNNEVLFTYFGVYMAVFGGLYLLTAFLDRCKYVDKLVDSLTESAYSKVREELLSNPVTAKELENLEKEEEQKCFEKICACSCICGGAAKVNPESGSAKKYHRSFRVALLKKRLFYDLKLSDLPKDSCLTSSCFKCCCDKPTCCCCFTSNKWIDKLYYLLNNHSLIAMFAAEKEHPTSRAERRMDYFIQNAIALAFSCAIVNGGFDFATAFAINVFIGTPVITVTKLLFYYFTSCPCLEFHSENCCVTKLQSCLIWIGESMGRIIAIASIFMFLLAAFASYTTGDFSNLAKYCYQIFIISQTQEVILTYLKFVETNVTFKICGFTVFQTGEWTVEYAKHRGIDLKSSDNMHRVCCLGSPCIFAIYVNKSIDDCIATTQSFETSEPTNIAKASELEMGTYQPVQNEPAAMAFVVSDNTPYYDPSVNYAPQDQNIDR